MGGADAVSFFGLWRLVALVAWVRLFSDKADARGKTFADFSHRSWPDRRLNRTSNADAERKE